MNGEKNKFNKQESDVHDTMFKEMKEKTIFDQARDYAYQYADGIREQVVYPREETLKNLDVFDEPLPVESQSSAEILSMLHRYGSPATVAQTGGRYYGLVNGGVVPAALASRWLSDFWDQNTPLYVTSPVVSRLETVVEAWLRDIFQLPEGSVAGFVSGTSLAIMSGLAAARYRVYANMGWDVNARGLMNAPRVRIVAGRQAHSTVIKAIALLGFGKENIEWVDTDSRGRLNPAALPVLDNKTILILQAGNVKTGSFDAFDPLCDLARKAGSWVHIDGAFGLWAAGCRKLRHLTEGIQKADSWSADGHKSLNTPYDCGIVLCRDEEALVKALQATGSYIVYNKDRQKRDGMLYTPEMSRRARIVELWATLKFLGKNGLDELIRGLHERACQFAEELAKNGFIIHNEVAFNQVLTSCGNDPLTEKTLEYLVESGECWCGGADWNESRVIRLSVCSWATTKEDISRSVEAFIKARDMAGATL